MAPGDRRQEAPQAGGPVAAAPGMPANRGRTWIGLPELLALRHARFNWPLPAAGHVRSGPARLTPLRARGMEFDEVRAWQPGDDPRHMHWKATARTGRPYTKLYQEESERPTVLCVDLTPAMHFATVNAFKSVLAARLAIMAAWAAVAARDRVSGLIMTSAGPRLSPPGPGASGARQLAAALSQAFTRNGRSQLWAGERRRYRDAFEQTTRSLAEIARRSGGAYLQFRTDEDPVRRRPGKAPNKAGETPSARSTRR